MADTRKIIIKALSTTYYLAVIWGFSGMIILSGIGIFHLVQEQAKTDLLCEWFTHQNLQAPKQCADSAGNWLGLQILPYLLPLETIGILTILLKADLKKIPNALKSIKERMQGKQVQP